MTLNHVYAWEGAEHHIEHFKPREDVPGAFQPAKQVSDLITALAGVPATVLFDQPVRLRGRITVILSDKEDSIDHG